MSPLDTKIPFQMNDGGIVALIPDGRVEYFDPKIGPYLTEINAGRLDHRQVDFTSFIIHDPTVRLDGFRLASPAIAFLELTNLCNLTCKHCYASSGPFGKRKF